MLKLTPYFDEDRTRQHEDFAHLPPIQPILDGFENVWDNVGKNGVTASLTVSTLRDESGTSYYDLTCIAIGRITIDNHRFVILGNGWLVDLDAQIEVVKHTYQLAEEQKARPVPQGNTFNGA